ncbi:MAG: transporter [Deltaproteobacteria bacterium]|nr:transporter [Deltaproteobacteria bacterium]
MHGILPGRPVIVALVLLLCAVLPASRAVAAEPFVNLGFTSFVDGFGDPTGDGFAFVQYLRFSTSSSLKDRNGDDAAGFVDPRLRSLASVTQLLYTFKKIPGLGVSPGLSVLVPVVLLDAEFGAGGASLRDNGFGVGDIFVGPSIQLPTLTVGEQPFFFNRLEFDVMLPVGKYDRNRQINQGNNFWALNPFWVATLLAGRYVEISWRLQYLYNFKNSGPVFAPPGAPELTSTKAGQAFHVNLAASVEVVPKTLRVGVSSYFLRQFTDSEENGQDVAGSQEQVLGVGPGLVWFPGKNDLLYLNVYFETAVRNRFQSHSAQVLWGHAFEGF